MGEEMMCCPLEGSDDSDHAEFCDVVVIKSRREHQCTECREVIPKGTHYERTKGKWDGYISTFKICLSCVEIRTHFACNGVSIYGQLWSDLEENFFPDMKAGGPCMQGLSPQAKARLFERRLKWQEDNAE